MAMRFFYPETLANTVHMEHLLFRQPACAVFLLLLRGYVGNGALLMWIKMALMCRQLACRLSAIALDKHPCVVNAAGMHCDRSVTNDLAPIFFQVQRSI